MKKSVFISPFLITGAIAQLSARVQFVKNNVHFCPHGDKILGAISCLRSAIIIPDSFIESLNLALIDGWSPATLAGIAAAFINRPSLMDICLNNESAVSVKEAHLCLLQEHLLINPHYLAIFKNLPSYERWMHLLPIFRGINTCWNSPEQPFQADWTMNFFQTKLYDHMYVAILEDFYKIRNDVFNSSNLLPLVENLCQNMDSTSSQTTLCRILLKFPKILSKCSWNGPTPLENVANVIPNILRRFTRNYNLTRIIDHLNGKTDLWATFSLEILQSILTNIDAELPSEDQPLMYTAGGDFEVKGPKPAWTKTFEETMLSSPFLKRFFAEAFVSASTLPSVLHSKMTEKLLEINMSRNVLLRWNSACRQLMEESFKEALSMLGSDETLSAKMVESDWSTTWNLLKQSPHKAVTYFQNPNLREHVPVSALAIDRLVLKDALEAIEFNFETAVVFLQPNVKAACSSMVPAIDYDLSEEEFVSELVPFLDLLLASLHSHQDAFLANLSAVFNIPKLDWTIIRGYKSLRSQVFDSLRNMFLSRALPDLQMPIFPNVESLPNWMAFMERLFDEYEISAKNAFWMIAKYPFFVADRLPVHESPTILNMIDSIRIYCHMPGKFLPVLFNKVRSLNTSQTPLEHLSFEDLWRLYHIQGPCAILQDLYDQEAMFPRNTWEDVARSVADELDVEIVQPERFAALQSQPFTSLSLLFEDAHFTRSKQVFLLKSEDESRAIYELRNQTTRDPSLPKDADKEVPVEDDCAICWQPFTGDNPPRALEICSHYFHHNCIQTALSVNPQCPLCRRNVTVQ